MKRRKLYIASAMTVMLLTACGQKSLKLTAGDVQTSTMLVGKNGNIQSEIIETFDKSYYKEEELKEYLEDTAELYNESEGKGKVELSSMLVKDETASAVLTYETMEDYQALNGVEAVNISLSEGERLLPSVLEDLDGKETEASAILEEEKAGSYKLLLIEEEYDVVVEGDIKYYSNCVLIDNTKVHTSGTGISVIIYK